LKQGQNGEVGDPLYVIDSRMYEANLKKAETQVMAVNAKLKIGIAQLERSKVEQEIADVDVKSAQVAQAKIDVEHCNVISGPNENIFKQKFRHVAIKF
jgi:multidrug resistance efflux pump